MKLYVTLIIMSFFLTSCSSNKEMERKVAYDYFLVPGLGVGDSGTFSPVSENYSITTKNVASRTNSNVAFDSTDDCGLNLVKQNNKNKKIPILAQPYLKEKIYAYGHNEFSGKIEKTEGFIANVALDGKKTCPIMLTTLSRSSGFSGGPVYNEKSELVGVMEYTEDSYGIDDKTGVKYSVMIPTTSFSRWLKDASKINDYGNKIIDLDYKNNNVLKTYY